MGTPYRNICSLKASSQFARRCEPHLRAPSPPEGCTKYYGILYTLFPAALGNTAREHTTLTNITIYIYIYMPEQLIFNTELSSERWKVGPKTSHDGTDWWSRRPYLYDNQTFTVQGATTAWRFVTNTKTEYWNQRLATTALIDGHDDRICMTIKHLLDKGLQQPDTSSPIQILNIGIKD